jgi:hypothetical protein
MATTYYFPLFSHTLTHSHTHTHTHISHTFPQLLGPQKWVPKRMSAFLRLFCFPYVHYVLACRMPIHSQGFYQCLQSILKNAKNCRLWAALFCSRQTNKWVLLWELVIYCRSCLSHQSVFHSDSCHTSTHSDQPVITLQVIICLVPYSYLKFSYTLSNKVPVQQQSSLQRGFTITTYTYGRNYTIAPNKSPLSSTSQDTL